MSTRKLAALATFIILVLGFAVPTAAKSLYVIAHHDGTYSAYNINPGGTVAHQADYPSGAWGPAGMAVHSASATVFVTYEFSGSVVLVDATTMVGIGSVPAPGASDLAGIDVDDVNDIVYAVDRYTDHLYAYGWDGLMLTLKAGYPIELAGCGGAFGIALDEMAGTLYVTCYGGGLVRGYDTTTWGEVTQFKPAMDPVGIAVDRLRGYVYTTAPAGYCANSPSGNSLLSKYDLTTRVETTVDMGHGGMGLAVDELKGYLYATGGCDGDDLSVWDLSLSMIQSTGYIGSPAGLTLGNVSFNPLNLTKDDGFGDDECLVPGATFTYEICYDNTGNTFEVTNATLTDNLPVEVRHVSGGTYDAMTHTATWSLGTLPAGSAQACVDLVVSVAPSVAPEAVFTNLATIMSDETPPTTVEEDTTVCPMIPVPFDVEPTSCRNPLQAKGKGVLPTAILGTADFDVTQVNPATVALEGVAALRWSLSDVATPFEPYLAKEDAFDCTELGPDGYLDFNFKFNKAEIVAALIEAHGDLEDGQVLVLTLTGNLLPEYGGIPILGKDVIVILK